MEGFSSPSASGAFTSIINSDDGGSSSGSEINELAQAMSTVHIRRRGRYESDMQCTPQSAVRPCKRIDVSEGMDEDKDEDKENIPAEPALDENKHVTPPKATPSRLDRITQLREELTCSVCLEICTRPCTTPCGHSFCRRCLRASLAHSSKCAKCREALPQGYLPKINTALWNTIQLLFPSEAAAGPPVTPNPEAPLQPSNRPNASGFRLNSHLVQSGRPPISRTSTSRPILTNPFRPPWHHRQQIHAPNRVQQQHRTASQAIQHGNGAAAGDDTDHSTRSSSTGGRGLRLAELLDQVEGASEEEFQGSSGQERASSRGRPASARAPQGHPLQRIVQATQQAEANQGSDLSRRLAASQRQQQEQQQQQQQQPHQRLPGAPRLHLVSAQRDHPQEQEQEQRLQQRQRWQQWQQLQRGGGDHTAAGTALGAAPTVAAARASEDEVAARASADEAVASLQLSFSGATSRHPGLVASTAQATEVAESAGARGHDHDPAAPDLDARAPARSLNPFVRSTHRTMQQPHSASAAPCTSAGSHSAAAAAPPPPPPSAPPQPPLHQQHHSLSQNLFRQLLRPSPSPESPPYAADPAYFSSAPVHTVAAGSGDSTARGSHAPPPQPYRLRRRVQHGEEEFVGRAEEMEAAHCDGVDGMGGENGHANSSESDGAGGLASAPSQGHTGGDVGVAHALGSRLGGAAEHYMWPALPGSRSNPIEILSSDTDGEEEEHGCPAEQGQDPLAVQQQAAAAAAPAAEPPLQAQITPHQLADPGSLGPSRITHAQAQQLEGGLQHGGSDGLAPARPAPVLHTQQVSLHPWVVPGIRRSNSSSSTRSIAGSASAALRPMGVARSTLARSTLLAGCHGAASVPGLRRPRPRNQD